MSPDDQEFKPGPPAPPSPPGGSATSPSKPPAPKKDPAPASDAAKSVIVPASPKPPLASLPPQRGSLPQSGASKGESLPAKSTPSSKPPAAAKLAPTKPVAKSQPKPANNEIVIRTMQDDLTAAQTGQTVPPRAVGASAPPAAVSAPTSKGSDTAPVIPVPAVASPEKVVMPPRKRRRRRRGLLISIIVVVLLLAGAATAGYFVWFRGLGSPAPDVPADTSSTVAVPATQVIPADTVVIIKYTADTAADLSAIQSAWGNSGTEATITSLLRGDPRRALNAGATELYYIVLADDPRPYLLLPRTSATEELLVNDPGTQVIEQAGWYIAHSVSTNLYTAALTTNTLDDIGGHSLLTTDTPGAPIKTILGPGALLQLRRSLIGTGLANGQLQELALAARFTAGNNGLEFTGNGVTLNPPDAALANQQLLDLIPGTASFVHLGGNFSADLATWATLTGALDEAILDSPQVTALLNQLTTSYGFYLDQSTPANIAYSLVVELPPSLQGQLTISDPALEQALRALVPLLTGRNTVAPIPFNDGTRGATALRFANLAGSTQAIDYSISNEAIFIATSKDAMFALLDTVAGQTESITTADTYRDLFQLWNAIPAATSLSLGAAQIPLLSELLPFAATVDEVRFGIAGTPDTTSQSVQVNGVLQLTDNVVTAQPPLITPPLVEPSPIVPTPTINSPAQ